MADKKQFVRLEHTQGHYKFYEIWIEASGGQYHKVMFQYGKIGTPGVMGRKTPNPVLLHVAQSVYNDVVSEKKGKGYQDVGAKKNAIELAPAMKILPKSPAYGDDLAPMQPTAAGMESLEDYVESSEWFAQEKMNGKFIRAASINGEVVAWNKAMKVTQLPMNVVTALEGSNVVVDGELIGDSLHVFDAIRVGKTDLSSHGAKKRWEILAGCQFGKSVKFVESSFGDGDKDDLVAHLKKKNMEGVIFKKVDGAYRPGKTENLSAAVCVKVKFWREVSAKLLEWTDKNSVRLGLFDPHSSEIVYCGKVTVPEKYKQQINDAGSGAILRVKYLYATKEGILYQPSLDPDDNGMVVRDDVKAPDRKTLLKYEGKEDDNNPKSKRNLIL